MGASSLRGAACERAVMINKHVILTQCPCTLYSIIYASFTEARFSATTRLASPSRCFSRASMPSPTNTTSTPTHWDARKVCLYTTMDKSIVNNLRVT